MAVANEASRPDKGSADNPRTPGAVPGVVSSAQGVNLFGALKFDTGGLVFRGANGSGGDFSVSGNGPQTGAHSLQANFEEGTFAGDFEHHNDWRDGLPHNFRGWGPQTPNPGPSPHPGRIPLKRDNDPD